MSLFKKDTVFWIEEKIDWKKAIKLGVEKLVEQNKATQKLEDAILNSTKEFGAYYVLEKGIALLHAAPGDYSIAPATSTLVLPNEITFNNQEDKTAKIIITLSAPDATSHMKYIQEFANYFMDKDFKAKILQVKNIDEFWFLVENHNEREA